MTKSKRKPKSLDQYREEMYLTVQEFADFLGVSLGTLYSAKHGRRPRATTMRRVAEKLGVSPGEIKEFAVRPVDAIDEEEG